MAALLRRSRLIWETSQFLGPTVRPLQDVCASRYAMSQSAPFSAARTGTATRGRKKAKDQETITGTKDASEGQLGDGHSTPAKPKRSPTAYIQFFKEQFPELKKNSSGTLNMAEASKTIAQKWKGLSEEDRQPYLATAVAAKLAHPVKSTAAKEKTPTKMNGYRLFVKENFEAVKARNPTIRTPQVMTAMGHEWKAKAQEEKDAYIAKAEEYNRTLKLS